MNQILVTKNTNKKNKIFYKFQFSISIIVLTILIFSIFYFIFSIETKKALANKLVDNYNVYKLYSNYQVTNFEEPHESNLFGIIEIPKINIYYPVFSHLDENLLKISPCKFYGGSPYSTGNICIAGHNYNNNMFFSKINLLSKDDDIYIYNNLNKKFTYKVFTLYEVNESDLSPIFNFTQNSKELTLITCNNLNSNRFIIKANQINAN